MQWGMIMQKFKHLGDHFLGHYLRFEHHIAAGSFLFGFILDIIIFTHVDFWLKHLILAVYLMLAGGGIVLFQRLVRTPHEHTRTLRAFLPFMIQFAFGAMLSGMFVYYFRSAAITQSWLFMGALLGMLIGNEFLRSRYHRLEFQVIIWFICLYSFTIIILPYFLATIGKTVFIGSTLLAIAMIAIFITILGRAHPTATRETRHTLVRGIALIIFVLNVLYVTKIIPPIPLALAGSGVFHSIARTTEGNYLGEREMLPWHTEIIPFTERYHVPDGGPLYFYSAIAAPGKLNTPITHEWQYKDPASGRWKTALTITFPIIGGREEGYRAYSQKTAITPGEWRVRVLTKEGHVIGSRRFSVVSGEPTALQSITQ
jgi:hypothetical protein